jgi:hypothetical protein
MARRLIVSGILLGVLAIGFTDLAAHDRGVSRLRLHPAAKPQPEPEFPREPLPLFPQFQQEPPAERPRAESLTLQSRLELRRYIEFEFASAVKTIPGGKKGFRYSPNQPLDEQALRNATGSSLPAAHAGDKVQITRLEFRNSEILVEINGGGKKRRSWRERIQISGGGTIPTVSSTTHDPNAPGGPPGLQGGGTTLILDYGKAVPDLTVGELKQHLAVFLNFDHRSAAVHWIETLPPEFQQAIQQRRAVVGMDREMVIAAMGKPEKKVREKDMDGLETEDWIYGHPPAATVFVKFAGDKVISVKEFPN